MSPKDKPFGVGIVGCGFIGQKRAKALDQCGQLVACADLDIDRAESLARTNAAKVYRDWKELVWSPMVDVVIVATLHDSLAEITRTAAEAGKHVLVEKPAARNAAEQRFKQHVKQPHDRKPRSTRRRCVRAAVGKACGRLRSCGA